MPERDPEPFEGANKFRVTDKGSLVVEEGEHERVLVLPDELIPFLRWLGQEQILNIRRQNQGSRR